VSISPPEDLYSPSESDDEEVDNMEENSSDEEEGGGGLGGRRLSTRVRQKTDFYGRGEEQGYDDEGEEDEEPTKKRA
jgi:hypothetical protein